MDDALDSGPLPSTSTFRCRKSGAETRDGTVRWGQHGEVGARPRPGSSPWGSPRFQRAASRKLLRPFLVLVGSSDRRFPIIWGRGQDGAWHFWTNVNRGLKPQGCRGFLGWRGEGLLWGGKGPVWALREAPFSERNSSRTSCPRSWSAPQGAACTG